MDFYPARLLLQVVLLRAGRGAAVFLSQIVRCLGVDLLQVNALHVAASGSGNVNELKAFEECLMVSGGRRRQLTMHRDRCFC